MREWKLFVDDERVEPHGFLKDENGNFLKDGRKFIPEWTFAHNYEKAIELIKEKGLPIEATLDHDLWNGLIQGSEFVEWFEMYVNQGHPLPPNFKYSIHSSNDGGREFMHEVMKRITGQEAVHLKVWWS